MFESFYSEWYFTNIIALVTIVSPAATAWWEQLRWLRTLSTIQTRIWNRKHWRRLSDRGQQLSQQCYCTNNICHTIVNPTATISSGLLLEKCREGLWKELLFTFLQKDRGQYALSTINLIHRVTSNLFHTAVCLFCLDNTNNLFTFKTIITTCRICHQTLEDCWAMAPWTNRRTDS